MLYLLHHYQNASIQGRQIQCRIYQLQVSHVDKDMVEQSHTTPYTICKEYLNHPLGLTLSTPGLVLSPVNTLTRLGAPEAASPTDLRMGATDKMRSEVVGGHRRSS